MELGFSEDFTSDVVLDSQLKAVPSSGLFINTGVDPCITVENLLDHLPKLGFTFTAWDNTKEYNSFMETRDRTNIVSYNSKIYECILTGTNQTPDDANSLYWVETNIESLRLKIFLQSVRDRVYSDLGLTRRFINNQYIQDSGKATTKTLPSDYSAMVIDSKGSDYVVFRINEMCLRKSGTTAVNVYVVHEGELLQTVTLQPDNGRNTFRATDITLPGKGRFYLAIDSTEVLTSNAYLDPYKWKGFVIYCATGTGVSAASAQWSEHTNSIGMGINITAYLNPSKFIENNISELAPFIKATFEYMAFKAFLTNPNHRSNRSERGIPSEEILMAELKRFDGDTVVRRYSHEKKQAKMLVDRVYDTELSEKKGKLTVNIGSV